MSYESNLAEYRRIIQEFLEHRMESSAFVDTFIRIWKADWDAVLSQKTQWAEPFDEKLSKQRHDGDIDREAFADAWSNLWKMTPHSKRLRDLLDQIFSACNVFNEEPDRENYELDEVGLREEVMLVASELAKLHSSSGTPGPHPAN
jgi:hypothetical protein